MKTQSGNVLFLILIAIALLGALTVLLSRTGGQSDDTGGSEQASIVASEILKQAAGVQNAVNSLRARGCSENELDFHDAKLSHNEFKNPLAAANEKCNIFHVNGAGLKYWKLPKTHYVSSATPNYDSISEYVTDVNASYNVVGTPTNTSDLVYYVYSFTKEICVAINRSLGVPLETNGEPSIEDYGAWWEYYKGRFRTDTNGIGNIVAAKHSGKKAACIKDADNGDYSFYYVLIAK